MAIQLRPSMLLCVALGSWYSELSWPWRLLLAQPRSVLTTGIAIGTMIVVSIGISLVRP